MLELGQLVWFEWHITKVFSDNQLHIFFITTHRMTTQRTFFIPTISKQWPELNHFNSQLILLSRAIINIFSCILLSSIFVATWPPGSSSKTENGNGKRLRANCRQNTTPYYSRAPTRWWTCPLLTLCLFYMLKTFEIDIDNKIINYSSSLENHLWSWYISTTKQKAL